MRIVFYSIGLTVFLNERWITPDGNFLNNVIAGIVLYAAAWLAALIVAGFFSGKRR